ncbi:MAG TPA: DUF4278 domain-containing protein [Coleofasciculaceae cyanobacterium]
MKLFYRGISYETEPSALEVSEGEIGGQYRGHAWRVHTPAQQPLRYGTPVKLNYRGAAYRRR